MYKQMIHKIRAGLKDEKGAIKYYKGFTKKQLDKLTIQEQKNIIDAEKDEKEHFKYLEKDKRTILGKRNR